MISTQSFVVKTKKGRVLKIVREHYLRKDIPCSSEDCTLCEQEENRLEKEGTSNSSLIPKFHYLIPDTNVVLHQLDVLEDPMFKNVIIPQTVIQEVRHRHTSTYVRLRSLISNKDNHFYVFTNEHHQDTYVERVPGETINDRNDRAIRKVAMWYKKHLQPKVDVVLLTNDQENLHLAKAEGLSAYFFAEYVRSIKDAPHLVDKMALLSTNEEFGKKIDFPEHLKLADIQRGVRAGLYLQGKFQASRENYLMGYVFPTSDDAPNAAKEDETNQDMILIQGRLNLNRVVHGDTVAVEILPEENWTAPSELVLEVDEADEEETAKEEKLLKAAPKPEDKKMQTGRIVGIVKRNWRPYCGILQPAALKDSTRHLFIPSERRIPKIRIETRQAEKLASQRLIVTIDRWPKDSFYPQGHYVRALGEIGDRETENTVLLLEHDIPHDPFSQAVLACLPSPDWSITKKDEMVRQDLRHITICSVDPPGCTDIDDALHCYKLENGNYNAGVHIADVSHFIRPNTAIDKEAESRGTTVYLVNKRIDMVPDLLSSNLCSLRGNEERLAFSVLWEMTPQAEIVSTKFCKSIIRSRAALTYAEAQLRIDDKSLNDDVTLGLRNLNMLAKIMKKRRTENGALTLASNEVRFSLDSETHDPIDVISKQLLETNSMVEEFMLQANISVAMHIHREFPECALLRRHPIPPQANFEPLIKAGHSKGFYIKTNTGKELADSLDAATIPEQPYFNVMLRMVATRCMTQALYFSSGTQPQKEYFHYGLAVPFYTHFTSPIRRYADVIVHRMLAASVGADTTYPELINKRKIQDICNNLNYRHKNAQYAGRASVGLYTQIYFKDKPSDEDGYVLFVKENALQVLIPKYGLESTLYLKEADQESSPFVFNEQEASQTAGGVVIHQFDPVKVRLSIDDSNVQRQKVQLELLQPEIPGYQPPKKKQKTT